MAEGGGLTLKALAKHRLLDEVLRGAANPSGGWRVLLVDDVTVKVFSAALKLSDVTDAEVSLVEDLYKRREPMPSLEGARARAGPGARRTASVTRRARSPPARSTPRSNLLPLPLRAQRAPADRGLRRADADVQDGARVLLQPCAALGRGAAAGAGRRAAVPRNARAPPPPAQSWTSGC